MWEQVLFIAVAGFISAVVDAIAGGGGLISLPALLLAGVPPHLALGTNKFASTTSSFTSSFTFFRSGKVSVAVVKWQVIFTFIGAALGVLTVLRINPGILNRLIPFLILVVALYTALRKNLGLDNRYTTLKRSSLIIGCCFAFVIGFYDGFFGPGTGSFLIFAFIATFGFDFLIASANAKVLNFTSNLASLIMFALNGKIALLYGIPMACFMIVGARVGSKLAIKNGAKLVRPVFIAMSLLMAIKMIVMP